MGWEPAFDGRWDHGLRGRGEERGEAQCFDDQRVSVSTAFKEIKSGCDDRRTMTMQAPRGVRFEVSLADRTTLITLTQ